MGKVTADISNFTSKYSNLNSKGKKYDISIFKLAHAAMTVGQDGYRSVFTLGFFRLAQLLCTILANVEDIGDALRINPRYYELEKSEKDSFSYLIGMAFTKVFAEELLNIRWLRHLKNVQNVNIQKCPIQNPSKIILYNNNKIARIPDLIGFENNHDVHVFESKGSCSGFKSNSFQHAIDQVSQVNTVNSTIPKTRVALFSDCNTNGINVHIVDPEKPDSGSNIEFDKSNPINGYYNIFLNNFWKEAPTRDILGQLYRIHPIGVPDIYFGINDQILKYLESEKNYGGFELPIEGSFYDGMLENNLQNVSISNDGTVLLGSLENYSAKQNY